MAVDPYVPTRAEDAPRRSVAVPPASGWRGARPGELGPGQPSGRLLGSPGPDGGYALTLAERFRDRLVLVAPEKPGDALAVGAGLAMKRAASFGRAPVVTDLEIAFTILGWLGDPPAALVEWRRRAVAGASRHYPELRAVVDAVPDEVLGRPLSEAGAAAGAWPW